MREGRLSQVFAEDVMTCGRKAGSDQINFHGESCFGRVRATSVLADLGHRMGCSVRAGQFTSSDALRCW